MKRALLLLALVSLFGCQHATQAPRFGTAIPNANTFTAHAVLVGNGTSVLTALGTGVSGNVLQTNGSGSDPSWVASSAGSTPTVATVVTNETTASASYVDLATVGPSVTIAIGANGTALVYVSAQVLGPVGAVTPVLGLAIDGVDPSTTSATTADKPVAWASLGAGNAGGNLNGTFRISGLSIANHTFKLRYAVIGASATNFVYRTVAATPL